MPRIFLFVISICFMNGLRAQSSGVRFANINLEAAKQRAVIEDKLIFVDTYASYCKPCKQLDLEFKNPKLSKYLNKHFINVKVNMEGKFGNDFKIPYQVIFLPTVMILDQHGNLRFKIDRLATADELLALSKHYQEKYYPTEVGGTVASTTRPTTSRPSTTSRSATTTKSTTPTSRPVSKPTQTAPTSRPVATTRPTTTTRPATQQTTKKTQPTTTKKEEVIIANNTAQVRPNTNKSSTTKSTVTASKENPVKTSEGNIVHVLGQGGADLPPEILKREAYLRLEFMDGSHIAAAQKYLDTQSDLNSSENMRFAFDFLYSVNTKSFEHLIANKSDYIKLLGQSDVDRTIDILVTKELERAYPRPDLEKAKELYGLSNAKNAERLAVKYYLDVLLDENKDAQFESLAGEYVSEYECKDDKIYSKLAIIKMKNNSSRREYKKASKYIKEAQKLNPLSSEHVLTEAAIQYKLGNVNQALELGNSALKIAKANSQNVKEINSFLDKLSRS